MAIKHEIDCKVSTQDETFDSKATVIKCEDTVTEQVSGEEALKSEGKCRITIEKAGVQITFVRSELLKLLRFMEG